MLILEEKNRHCNKSKNTGELNVGIKVCFCPFFRGSYAQMKLAINLLLKTKQPGAISKKVKIVDRMTSKDLVFSFFNVDLPY